MRMIFRSSIVLGVFLVFIPNLRIRYPQDLAEYRHAIGAMLDDKKWERFG